jgi:hypothetical protein
MEIVKAVEKTDIRFVLNATSLHGIKVNTLPINWNNGVPGGCVIPIMYEQALNSPQSQNETVGAIVIK